MSADHDLDSLAGVQRIILASYLGRKDHPMSGASKWQCSCGYQATSQQDLDEHTGSMAALEPEGSHQQQIR